MTDLLTMIAALKRPKLLIQAARFGVADYKRERLLKRILRISTPRSVGAIVMALLEIEADLNTQRIEERTEYCAQRHVEVMIALMGEARLLRASQT